MGNQHPPKLCWRVAVCGKLHFEITFVFSLTNNTADKQTETDGVKILEIQAMFSRVLFIRFNARHLCWRAVYWSTLLLLIILSWVPVAARSKAWVYGRSFAGIAG